MERDSLLAAGRGSNGAVERVGRSDEEWRAYRWRFAVPASCVLMFIFGTTYGLAVFLLPLGEVLSAFVPAFTASLGVQSFAIAITMLVGGYLLDARPHQLRLFLLAGAFVVVLSILGIAFSVFALSPRLLYWSSTIMGLGLGTFYISGVEHAARWMPEYVGLAMGLGMGSLGVGSIVGAQLFSLMLEILGLVPAIYGLIIILAVPVVLILPVMSFPTHDVARMLETAGEAQSSSNTLMGQKLGSKLLVQPSFYLLLIIVAMGAGPGYGTLVAFPSIVSSTFDLTPSHIASLFAFMNVLGMLTRFVVGFSVDYFSFGTGFFWSGAKNMAILVLAIQTVALCYIQTAIVEQKYVAFMVCIAILLMSFAASAVLAAVLSRQIFSPANSAIVFGFAGGLTDGLTTMLFSILVASISGKAELIDKTKHAELYAVVYSEYFARCVWWSLLGLICAIAIQRCSAAYEYTGKSGDTVVVVEHHFFPPEKSAGKVDDRALAALIASHSEADEEGEFEQPPHPSLSSLSSSYRMMGGHSLRSQRFEGYLAKK